MKLKLLSKLLVVVMAATIPGVVATTSSNAFGTTLYTSKEWKKILNEAKGQTVNWYMWGGSTAINTYVNEYIGYNSRLDEVQAGFLRIKLKYLDEITSHKRSLAQIYLDNLSPHFVAPSVQRSFYDERNLGTTCCSKN